MTTPDCHVATQPVEALNPQLPVTLPLLEKRRESPDMVSLFFPHPDPPGPSFVPLRNRPGQFIMVWIPGVNEKPFVISYMDEECFGITVLVKGAFTQRLTDSSTGRRIGFRGPYGRGFWDWEEHPEQSKVVIGGGCGMAPLALLAERGANLTIIQGAPSGKDVLYADRFPEQIVYTEDGSMGHTGFPTQWLSEALGKGGVDSVYTCGPEAMMSSVVATCRMEGVPCQAAMERYMKCAIGVCGQCECDGRLVCQDGPVFSAQELRHMPSFSRIRRDATGRTVNVATNEHCSLEQVEREK